MFNEWTSINKFDNNKYKIFSIAYVLIASEPVIIWCVWFEFTAYFGVNFKPII